MDEATGTDLDLAGGGAIAPVEEHSADLAPYEEYADVYGEGVFRDYGQTAEATGENEHLDAEYFLAERPHLQSRENLEVLAAQVQDRAVQLGDPSLASDPTLWRIVDHELLANSGDLQAKAANHAAVAKIANVDQQHGLGNRVLDFNTGGVPSQPSGQMGASVLNGL